MEQTKGNLERARSTEAYRGPGKGKEKALKQRRPQDDGHTIAESRKPYPQKIGGNPREQKNSQHQ